ncbi:MAG TPA: hypothetical protein VF171_00525 [Trueperaceae bacterium]
MALVQGLLFLVFGVGLLSIDYQNLQRGGRLPAGPNGLRGRQEFESNSQAFGFWVMFALYGFGGLWLVIFALQLLLGYAEPLR